MNGSFGVQIGGKKRVIGVLLNWFSPLYFVIKSEGGVFPDDTFLTVFSSS